MSKKRPDKQAPIQQGRPAAQPQQAQAPKKAPEKPKQSATRSGLPWHPFWRFLVSLLVTTHLLAVFTAPWALTTGAALPPSYQPANDNLPPGNYNLPMNWQPPRGFALRYEPELQGVLPPNAKLPPGYTLVPDRPMVPSNDDPVWQEPVVPQTLHWFFQHYLNLAYLNHGYNFFAPDPAGTHVIRYQVPQISGEPLEREFPNLQQQWPRLLYHRHMMLAEQTWGMGPESGQHYADHLSTLHGVPIKIDLYFHTLLDPQSVIDGRELNEASTYVWQASVNGQPRAEDMGQAQSQEEIVIPGAGQ